MERQLTEVWRVCVYWISKSLNLFSNPSFLLQACAHRWKNIYYDSEHILPHGYCSIIPPNLQGQTKPLIPCYEGTVGLWSWRCHDFNRYICIHPVEKLSSWYCDTFLLHLTGRKRKRLCNWGPVSPESPLSQEASIHVFVKPHLNDRCLCFPLKTMQPVWCCTQSITLSISSSY